MTALQPCQSAQRSALLNAKSLVHDAPTPQEPSLISHNSQTQRSVNSQLGEFRCTSSWRSTALTRASLHGHQFQHQRQQQTTAASPTYEYTTRTGYFIDGTEVVHSFNSIIPLQITDIELVEAMLPSNLHYHTHRGYLQSKSLYGQTTRTPSVRPQEFQPAKKSCSAFISSLQTEAGSADDYRLSEGSEDPLTYAFKGIYGLDDQCSYILTGIGTQFAGVPSRDSLDPAAS